jgi:hypothetical protein
VVPAIAGHGLRIAAFCILGAISISVQAVGVYCYPGGAWDAFPYPVDTHRVWDWKDNPISRSFHAGIDKQPYRSFDKLFRRETWTLANTGQRVAPVDLAMARWWALPDPLDVFHEVSLSQLAGIINTPVLLEGAWTSNGYYPGVGHPNISGEVYGSWTGSDANTGVLRMGPFQIAKQAAIAIPLTTGPKTTGLVVKVMNAVTGDLIAALSPPPFLNRWWAWQVDLPVEELPLTVNILAEDQGKEWGQWLALGMPELLKDATLGSMASVNDKAEQTPFDRLGSAPQAIPVACEGGWTKDGLYPAVAGPPIAGPVYGSWSGSDTNKGIIKLGPLYVRNAAAIAIPLITGPRNVGMEVKVVDVKTGELLGVLSPPPARLQWWAWRVALPEDQPEMTIMIIAEDNGAGWGQWQGIGAPHRVK